jgi:hypothetical protein
MIHGKYDVQPSVENHGLTVRARVDAAVIDKLPTVRKQQEIATMEATNALAVVKYQQRITDANTRDLFTTTANGLPIVGPAAADAMSVTGMAHNFAMVLIDQKIAELESKIAQLSASK